MTVLDLEIVFYAPTHIYLYTYTRTYALTHARTHERTHAGTHVHTQTHTHVIAHTNAHKNRSGKYLLTLSYAAGYLLWTARCKKYIIIGTIK